MVHVDPINQPTAIMSALSHQFRRWHCLFGSMLLLFFHPHHSRFLSWTALSFRNQSIPIDEKTPLSAEARTHSPLVVFFFNPSHTRTHSSSSTRTYPPLLHYISTTFSNTHIPDTIVIVWNPVCWCESIVWAQNHTVWIKENKAKEKSNSQRRGEEWRALERRAGFFLLRCDDANCVCWVVQQPIILSPSTFVREQLVNMNLDIELWLIVARIGVGWIGGGGVVIIAVVAIVELLLINPTQGPCHRHRQCHRIMN